MLQALRIFELAQLRRRIDLDIGIGADAEAAFAFKEQFAVENAIAKTAFGERAQARDRAGVREPLRLVVGHVGRMNKTPALIDPGIVEQPLHRPRAERCDAVVHFPGLFCGMDVNRDLREGFRHRAQLLRRDRTQRMRRDTEFAPGTIATISRVRAISVRNRSVELRKRACPELGAALPKPP